MIFRDMDQLALDAAYNNTAAVGPLQQARAAEWKKRSEVLFRTAPVKRDLRYGDGPRQRIDFFPCGRAGAPTLLFIHGGYWQMNDKEHFGFVAEGPLSQGINFAAIEYTLAPAIRMDGIVEEIRRAVAWTVRHLGELGAATDGVYVAGHSAGGHLAAMVIAEPGIKGAITISGIFDLEPIRLCYLNDKISMDGPEAQRNSPLLHLPSQAPPLIVTVGGDELPELCRQSEEYHRAWIAKGLKAKYLPLGAHEHFSILEELANPAGKLAASLAELTAG
jgi:arylformamidase